MKDFLKYIPGFRSDKRWKKVIAVIYYLFSLLMLVAEIGLSLFLLGMPFLIFSIVDLFKSKKQNKPIKTAAIGLVISLLVTSVGFAMIEPVETDVGKDEPVVEEVEDEPEEIEEEIEEPEEPEEPKKPEKETFEEKRDLKVHFIDVGQGDSVLIQLPNGETALIDAGTKDKNNLVVDYLKKNKIEKIDYLIATHPHEDHIGGLPKVIKTFNIGNIYMPEVTHTTNAFEDLILAIQDKGKEIDIVTAGDTLIDLDGLTFTAFAPEENLSDDNLNNHSIVLKLTYKNNSFLFTGDAESGPEQSMIGKDYDLKSSVLKVAHHGSDTSTTDQFLKKVKPNHAVISVGSNNKYGHPDQTILDRLNNIGAKIYRTDENGTIVFTSNGSQLTVKLKKTTQAKKENAPPKQKAEKPKKTKEETKQNVSQSSQTEQNQSTKSKSGGSGGGNKGGGGSGNKAPKPPETNPEPITSSYLGNSNTKKFHVASCGHAKRIASHNRVNFNSREEAANSGYVPCKVCKP